MTIVCGDSHTSTHGAFGALAFGIGTTEVGHVMATQCLLQRKAKTLAIHVDGHLSAGVGAKDLILHIIGEIGVDGGTGYVIEYRGDAIEQLSMEERMTVCNMSIEAGARAGLIAPDETTFAWLKGRPRVPQGAAWDEAVARWKSLRTDDGAEYDREVRIDASKVRPTVTYGTHPGMAIAMDKPVPAARNAQEKRALDYMKAEAGKPMQGTPVDVVFVGSCTNSRLSDLREAARCAARSPRRRRCAHAGGARFRSGAPRCGTRRPAPCVYRSRCRMARAGLFDVHCHEWRFRSTGPTGGEHLQPQLRRPPGQGRAHGAGESCHCCGIGCRWAHR